MNQCCKSCRFHTNTQNEDALLIECHRNAPTETGWPVLDASLWCGEWEQVPQDPEQDRMMQKCSRCLHWIARPNHTPPGECRRHAPRLFMLEKPDPDYGEDEIDECFATKFPRTDPETSCGDWQIG